MVFDPISEIRAAVAGVAAELSPGFSAEFALERPPKAEFGDYSTNIAMLLAPALGEQPRAIAERVGEELGARLGAALDRADVAGPGFVNLFLTDAWCAHGVAGALAAGERFGAREPSGRRVNIEFVSANPTGPITVAAGRHAAYGDALARLLEITGDTVDREYYVNDQGSQIARFAASIRARAGGQEPPEDGYQREYVKAVAEAIGHTEALDDEELGRRGVEIMLEGVRATLERFGVRMDRFFAESTLHAEGRVSAALHRLEEREQAYPHEGAVWVRTSRFGDDKDRVLMRSDGEFTYFGADIAYHEDKRSRGYDLVIDVLGADHHGYVGRMRAIWQVIGGDPGAFEVVMMQLVNLLEGGRRAQMSKRAGTVVALDELIDDIGVDATRWFLLQRSHDTTLDLDLELARTQSQDNPVFYAQYAHARIASILRRAGEERVAAALAADVGASHERLHPSARALVKRLLAFPAEVREAADRRAPHRVTVYVTEVAQDFSAFYRDCKVVGAAEEGGDEDFRIAVCEVTRRTLQRGLELLGVAAPEEM